AGRQQHDLGRDRRDALPRPLTEEREEALREDARPRDAAFGTDVRERLAAGIDAGELQRDVRLDRRREVRRPLEPDRPGAVLPLPTPRAIVAGQPLWVPAPARTMFALCVRGASGGAALPGRNATVA